MVKIVSLLPCHKDAVSIACHTGCKHTSKDISIGNINNPSLLKKIEYILKNGTQKSCLKGHKYNFLELVRALVNDGGGRFRGAYRPRLGLFTMGSTQFGEEYGQINEGPWCRIMSWNMKFLNYPSEITYHRLSLLYLSFSDFESKFITQFRGIDVLPPPLPNFKPSAKSYPSLNGKYGLVTQPFLVRRVPCSC